MNIDEDKINYDESNLGFNDYVHFLRFHLLKILIILSIGIPTSIYINILKVPIYQSQATILVREAEASSLIMDFNGTRSKDIISNEIQKIKSRAVAKKVIEDLWNSREEIIIFEQENST